MDKLFKGVLKFQQEDFEAQRDLFSKLGRSQRPHTLFIGCSDSRVVPTLITRTLPGELFLVRNVANIVPPYRDTGPHDCGTAAAVEYAVQVLQVEAIVVCGHSNCGGCAALHAPPTGVADLPHTGQWLQFAQSVKPRVARLQHSDSIAEREWLTEQVNVLVQMRHLLSYPYVAEKLKAGRLRLMGWYYIIESGMVLNFNDDTGRFEEVV